MARLNICDRNIEKKEYFLGFRDTQESFPQEAITNLLFPIMKF